MPNFFKKLSYFGILLVFMATGPMVFADDTSDDTSADTSGDTTSSDEVTEPRTVTQSSSDDTVSDAAASDPEAMFENVRNRAQKLSKQMTAIANYTPEKLELERENNWWADYFAQVNGAKDVFGVLQGEAESAAYEGSDVAKMSWWDDLRSISDSVEQAIATRTAEIESEGEDPEQDFRLLKLHSAQSIVERLKKQAYGSIQSAVDSLDKIKRNLILNFEKLEKDLIEGRDEVKLVSKHTMASKKSSAGATGNRSAVQTAQRRSAARKAAGRSAQAGRTGRTRTTRAAASRGRSGGARRRPTGRRGR